MSPEGVVDRSLQRPSAPMRIPSHTYAPGLQRHPMNMTNDRSRHRSSSANRSRRDPSALYRSQEKAYVQRLRQDPNRDYFSSGPGLLGSYQHEFEMDDESPSEV